MCKALLFVLHVQMAQLLRMNANETLRHFSEMKLRPELCAGLASGFREFARRFPLDAAAFHRFEGGFAAAMAPRGA